MGWLGLDDMTIDTSAFENIYQELVATAENMAPTAKEEIVQSLKESEVYKRQYKDRTIIFEPTRKGGNLERGIRGIEERSQSRKYFRSGICRKRRQETTVFLYRYAGE